MRSTRSTIWAVIKALDNTKEKRHDVIGWWQGCEDVALLENVRLGEGHASACPDEQTLVPPVLSRITRIRFAIPCHHPITDTIATGAPLLLDFPHEP